MEGGRGGGGRYGGSRPTCIPDWWQSLGACGGIVLFFFVEIEAGPHCGRKIRLVGYFPK
jgi:hypothetical protein